MGIFSGVQVIIIICTIVRTKFVAMWVGPAGVGLFGLYNTAADAISSLSQLGIRNSAVRDIAAGRTSLQRISTIIYVVRRWAWLLGLAGAFLTLILSPALSRLTFSDSSHTFGFILLSIAIFLSSVTSGELAILQGMNQLNKLAKASVWGIITGLAVSLPLFYYLGEKSIVPSIVAYTAATAITTWVYRTHIPHAVQKPSSRQIFEEGKGFMKLGIFMTTSVFITLAVNYIFMAILNNEADTDTVGFYQAGYTIVNRYVGLVFTAIAMEYYPRLVNAAGSRIRQSTFVSHETLISMLVILPVATTFMALDDVAVRILYNQEFTVAVPFITWALVGTVLRAYSWCVAFVILARGDGRTYLWTESVSAVVSLGLNIVAYRIGGLQALGLAYIVWYLIYSIIVTVVYRYNYRLRINRNVIMIVSISIAVTSLCAFLRQAPTIFGFIEPQIAGIGASRIAVAIIALISVVSCFRRLRKMLHR